VSAADAVDVAALGELAERLARAAGQLVTRERPDGMGVAATKSSPTDVVTAMDLASEELLRAGILAERPDDGVLGEEGGTAEGTSGLTWVLDPIDGTVNYLYRIPAYAISVAVVRGNPVPGEWEVLAGCVHNPATGETWTATAGGGAFLDGVRLTAPAPVALEAALVGTGFGYVSEVRRAQARVVAELLPRVRDVRRIGAAALDLCAVASGRLDAYYESGLSPWDVAAGWLVVQEAGARVRVGPDLIVPEGADPSPRQRQLLVAGGEGIVTELHDLLGALAPRA
jgi:myo-inositol-1(or 4)-monophosphatase